MNILWDADSSALERYQFALGGDTQALDSAAMVARALHENPAIQQVIIGPEADQIRPFMSAERKTPRRRVGGSRRSNVIDRLHLKYRRPEPPIRQDWKDFEPAA